MRSLPLALLLSVAACDGPPAAAPAAATPPSASSAAAVVLPAPPPAPTAEASAAPAPPPAPEPPPKLLLIAPGAEPRAVRTYALVVGQTDKRVLTIRQGASREGQHGDEAAFTASLELTPRAVKDGTATVEVKLVKVELLGVTDPQVKAKAQAELAPFNGLVGTFELSPRGDASSIVFAQTAQASGQGAKVMEDSLGQAFEQIFPPFPDEAIGVGARWSRTTVDKSQSVESRVRVAFTLTAAAADGGNVTADVDVAVPKHVLTARGVPPGSTDEVTGKGTYAYVVKRDRVPSKVSGAMTITRHLEISADGAGQARKSIAEVITLKNTLETVK